MKADADNRNDIGTVPFNQTWEFNISIQETTSNPPLLCLNDSFIMEDMINSNLHAQQTLLKVNRCRLFLQTTTLSDIVDAAGTGI